MVENYFSEGMHNFALENNHDIKQEKNLMIIQKKLKSD